MSIRRGDLLVLMLLSLMISVYPGCSREQESTLARIRDAGEISAAMSADYPPFNYLIESGELEGFDVDVVLELAGRLGVKPKIVIKKWSGIIQGLLAGEYDIILGSMAISEERLKLVSFSIPYYHSEVRVVVREGSGMQDLDDLKGKTVGIGAGSNYENDARELGFADIRFFDPWTQGLLELQKGNLHAVIIDQIVGIHAVEFGKFKIQFLGPPLRREVVAIAVRKEDKSLLKAINGAVLSMQKDGFLAELGRKMARCEYDCSGRF
ncbi:MAG: transporter substrate-binding domain-containing protein [Deltaproteobacteria bacterium]|nr:transporter substrate-binding domain-containing protein [Deltaproteobacteria bacterium]